MLLVLVALFWSGTNLHEHAGRPDRLPAVRGARPPGRHRGTSNPTQQAIAAALWCRTDRRLSVAQAAFRQDPSTPVWPDTNCRIIRDREAREHTVKLLVDRESPSLSLRRPRRTRFHGLRAQNVRNELYDGAHDQQ